MKIFPSFSLELTAVMSPEEIKNLPLKPLECILKFKDREDSSFNNNINVTIEYGGLLKEHIEVKQTPDNVYFGEAKEIKFKIHHEIWKDLINGYSSGARFYGANGKLLIKIQNN